MSLSDRVLAEMLSDAGYEVVETGDPVYALGLPEAVGPPDVLITDIDLRSELNGFEVASYAHQLWPKVRIILISGLSADHTGNLSIHVTAIHLPTITRWVAIEQFG